MAENYDPISATQNSVTRQENIARVPPSLFFPQNYTNIDHFVTFQVLKFERVTRTSTINSDLPIASDTRAPQSLASRSMVNITLPMPGSLITEYNVSYDTPDISAIGELISTAASNARGSDPTQIGRAIGEAFSGPVNAFNAAPSFGTGIAAMHRNIQASVSRMSQNLGPLVNPAIAATAAGVAGRISPAVTATIANLSGVARNPHKVVLFTGANFREHRFTYSLTPKNAREADTIYNIIKKLKFHMSPKYGVGNIGQVSQGLIQGLGGEAQAAANAGNEIERAGATSRAFFEYPEVFRIRFNKETTLFSIGESVLKSFTVNYHPQNYPAYVRSLKGGNKAHPAEVVIDMVFLETDVITKEQIEQNGR